MGDVRPRVPPDRGPVMGRGSGRFSLNGVTKVYPGAVALQDVSLHVAPGEVVGLIGENGAGKSTLMKVLGGLVRPDRGSIGIDDEDLPALTPAAATARGNRLRASGTHALHQSRRGGQRAPWPRDHARAVRTAGPQRDGAKVAPILARIGATFAPDAPMDDLSLAEQQLVEIARALSIDARLLILDEPTSSLTLSETRTLLQVVGDLRRQGVAILFISHRWPRSRRSLTGSSGCATGTMPGTGRRRDHQGRDGATHDRARS